MSGELTLTEHAKRQMERRHVKPDEIADGLNSVEFEYISTTGTLIKACRTSSNRRLKVFVDPDNERKVITVADRDEED